MELSTQFAVVRAALAAIHEPSSTHDARRQAHGVLGQFMQALPAQDAFQAAHQLLLPLTRGAPLTSDPEILLGFQLLDEKILRVPPWTAHAEQLRADVRKLSVSLLSHASPRLYKQYVVVKSAALVVALAIREWPQHWPTFVNDLLSGNLPQQVVCEVLRILSEDVHEFNSCTEAQRRAELTVAMSRNLPAMLSYITSAANSFVQNADSPGLMAAIAAIESFMSWAPLQHIFSAGLPNACISLLSNSEFCSAALSALNVLAMRTDKGDVPAQPGFREEVFPRLLEFLSTGPLLSIQALSYARPAGLLPGAVEAFERFSFREEPKLLEVDPDQHEFNVNFMAMFAKLGVSHFLQAFIPPNGQESPNAPSHNVARAYVDVMLSAVASPSVAIRAAVVPFFSRMLAAFNRALHKEGILRIAANNNSATRRVVVTGSSKLLVEGLKTAFVQDIMATLVRKYVNTASLSMTNWPNDGLRRAYSEVDYCGDDDQLGDQTFTVRGRTVNNIGIAAKLLPNVILPLALGRLMDVLTKANAIAWESTKSTTEVKGKAPYVQGFITEDKSPRDWTFGNFNSSQSKEMEAALEASVLSTEAVLAGISVTRCLETDAESYHLLQKLFEVVMGLTHSNLYAAKITAMRMFIPIFKKDPRALELCLKGLGQIIESSKNTPISYQACNSLASICRRLRRAKAVGLQAFLEPLCTFAVQAQETPDFGIGERNLLLEAAIAVTLSFGTVPEQTPVIEKLLNPLFSVLDQSRLKSVHEPEPLYNFMETAPESERTFSCLRTLEAAVHQVVRINRNFIGSKALLTPLSANVAPWMVKVAAPLVKAIHGLYNPSVFPLAGRDMKRTSILLPTSREIAYLLNLDGNSTAAAWNSSPIAGSFADGSAEDEHRVKSSLQRCDDLLQQYDISPPDPKYNAEREYLKGSRFAAYELLRAAILSGVCQAHMQTTLVELLNAMCSHAQFLEPIHLHYLLNKVVKHLLSFQVTFGNDGFLAVVNESQLNEVLGIVTATVEASHVGNAESDGPTIGSLDVSREHGRKMVARSAADVLAAMYPRDIVVTAAAEYIPAPFGHAKLAESLSKLWDVLCAPGRGVSDNGASRVALQILCRAVDAAPATHGALFLGRLEKCVTTAAQSDGMGSDSLMEPAVSAILSYFKKWPGDSVTEILRILGGMPEDFLDVVKKKLDDIFKVPITKNSRPKLRSLIRQISQKAGLSVRKVASVRTPGPPVRYRRPRMSRVVVFEDNHDVALGDRALDSLFGGGDPL